MGLADALQDTANSTNKSKGSSCTTQPCPLATSNKKVGVTLAFHPILFKKNENPAEEKDFYVIEAAEFPDCYLFPDGKSEAIIEVQVVRLNAKGMVEGEDLTSADSNDHNNEGMITLELDNALPGVLKYRTKEGRKSIDIPVADLVDGRTSLEKDDACAVRYVATTRLDIAKITVGIKGNSSYEFCPDFRLPQKSKMKLSLGVGTRKLDKGTQGYDVMKYQWYLRRFGFLAYDEQKMNDMVEGKRIDWANIGEIDTDGDWGRRMGACSRDFQLVSSGAFRNQANKDVEITFKATPDIPACGEQGVECAVWHEKFYKVEPYHGHVWIDDTSGGTRFKANGKIVYGALVEGGRNRGYLELNNPVGGSRCHWDTESFEVAKAVRTAIRLCRRDTVILRLHDADSRNQLDLPGFNPEMRRRTIALLQAGRLKQEADYSINGNWDLIVYSTYRTFLEQDKKIAEQPDATDARGGQSWHNYGLAVDIVFYRGDGGIQHGDYAAKGALGMEKGLFWPIVLKNGEIDNAHHQHKEIGKSPGKAVLNEYNRDKKKSDAERLRAVWTLLGI